MTGVQTCALPICANYDMATAYILGRVENSDFGLAIAYSSVLILIMLGAIFLIQFAVGKRRQSKRSAQQFSIEGSTA